MPRNLSHSYFPIVVARLVASMTFQPRLERSWAESSWAIVVPGDILAPSL